MWRCGTAAILHYADDFHGEKSSVSKERSTKKRRRRGRGETHGVIDRKWTKKKRKKKEGKIRGNEVADKMQSTLLRLRCEEERSEQRREGKLKQVEATQSTVDLREVCQMVVSLARNWAEDHKKPKAEVNQKRKFGNGWWKKAVGKRPSFIFPTKRKRKGGQDRRNPEGCKEGEACFAKWIGVEHGEEINDDIQKYFRSFPRKVGDCS